jgi:hypothetical protein
LAGGSRGHRHRHHSVLSRCRMARSPACPPPRPSQTAVKPA